MDEEVRKYSYVPQILARSLGNFKHTSPTLERWQSL